MSSLRLDFVPTPFDIALNFFLKNEMNSANQLSISRSVINFESGEYDIIIFYIHLSRNHHKFAPLKLKVCSFGGLYTTVAKDLYQ